MSISQFNIESPFLKGGTKYGQYDAPEQQYHATFLGIGKACDGLPLSKGSTGEKVKEVQTILGLPVDGVFGISTEAAVQKRLGTASISCEQYKQLTGRGITPEKIEAGVGILTSIFGALQKPKTQTVYVPAPAEESKTPWLWIGIGVALVIGGIIIFFTFKK